MELYNADFDAILTIGVTRGEDVYALRRICHELTRLVLQRRTVRIEMVEAGVLDRLHVLIRPHVTTEPTLVADCVHFLRSLISLKHPHELDIQSRIVEAGFLPLILEGLEFHAGNELVMIEICRLLALLCFDSPNAPHADNQSEIATSRVLAAVIAAIQAGDLSAKATSRACEVIFAVIYENESTAVEAIEDCRVVEALAAAFEQWPSAKEVVEWVCRALFQLAALRPTLGEALSESQFAERILDFLECERAHCDLTFQWHALKFLEMGLRLDESSKDNFCQCRGPIIVIQALQHARATTRSTRTLAGLYYLACMLFNRVAVAVDDGATTTAGVSESRIGLLMQSGVHQFAITVIKSLGQVYTHVAEQAVRLLELVASIEMNRIPLTRLGASRQVKVVYNQTTHAGLLVLCERAAAAIDGT